MPSAVRVRFPPSPTGLPHVGNIRTALFNWLFARHHGGAFILRIEDTDQTRKVPGAVEKIMESLLWLGLEWDEGPQPNGSEKGDYGSYTQSKRKEAGLYAQHAQRLVDSGHAYVCFCTPERLDAVRDAQRKAAQPPMYDRFCRRLTPAQRAEQMTKGLPSVVRLAVPPTGETTFEDMIRGAITVQNSTLDDQVLLKADGFPTYHLANVVDDHLMHISHVIRADEWIPSTPRHVLLYRAFGWELPHFAHLPLILGPDRSKLSKRHGDTSFLDYRDQGFLPEAMLNFLALIGWSLDDKTEMFTRAELIQHFSVDRVGKTGGIFNLEKLTWFNGVYLRKLAPEELAARMLPWLERELPPDVPRPLEQSYLAKIVPLIHERIKLLNESKELTDFFFVPTLKHDPALLVQKGMDVPGTQRALESAWAAVQTVAAWDHATLEGALRPLTETLGLKAGQFFGAIRVAVTGETVSPPLFQTMEVLGRERCLTRLRQAVASFSSVPLP